MSEIDRWKPSGWAPANLRCPPRAACRVALCAIESNESGQVGPRGAFGLRKLLTKKLSDIFRDLITSLVAETTGEQGGKEEDMLGRLGGNDKAKIFWKNWLS
jgi:hypothetical protein